MSRVAHFFLTNAPFAHNDLDVGNPWVCTSLGVGRSALLRYRLLPIPGLRGVLCFLFVEGRIWAPLPSPCAAIKELLLQSQQPSADGLRVSHDRSERDILVLCCFLLGARGGIGGLRIALVFTGLVSRFRASLQRHAPAGRQRASAWARAPSAFSDLSASRFGPGRKTNKESNRVRVINDQPAKPLVSKRGYAEQ